MKTYSDLQDIESVVSIKLELEPVGAPEICVRIGDTTAYGQLQEPSEFKTNLDLLTPFTIEIELKNKEYDINSETAVIIRGLSVDNIELIPKYDYLAKYINDHDNNNPTSYLGFNGKWTLTIDCPFYHWLHKHSGQGWLIG